MTATRLLAVLFSLLPGLTACERPAPIRPAVIACHREVVGGEPHAPDAIIEVAEHRKMLGCMALKKFIFQAQNPRCAVSTVQVDNPACYDRAAGP